MTALVAVESVTKTYASPLRVAALEATSLRIRQGETIAIMGPSGSGKSTLLSLLGGLDRPTSGRIFFRGDDISLMRDAELASLRAFQLGFVFQQFHLVEHLSVQENVAAGLLYRGVPFRRRRDAAATAIDRVGLSHRLTHRTAQLSGGERQRVAIARAIIGRPSLVLADEPTGNLDSANGENIMELLTGLADETTAVVVVTHDASIASGLARTVTLKDGRIINDTAARS
ncbi:MAG TPA: ABC transporter ATP-binding protein [Leifsonia sp.]|nr:ABC transporter ATP-binding protein [Leifsonia sp.]